MQVVVEAVFKMQDRLLVAYLLSVTLFNQILMRSGNTNYFKVFMNSYIQIQMQTLPGFCEIAALDYYFAGDY